jgi:hypothetical protein
VAPPSSFPTGHRCPTSYSTAELPCYAWLPLISSSSMIVDDMRQPPACHARRRGIGHTRRRGHQSEVSCLRFVLWGVRCGLGAAATIPRFSPASHRAPVHPRPPSSPAWFLKSSEDERAEASNWLSAAELEPPGTGEGDSWFMLCLPDAGAGRRSDSRCGRRRTCRSGQAVASAQ